MKIFLNRGATLGVFLNRGAALGVFLNRGATLGVFFNRNRRVAQKINREITCFVKIKPSEGFVEIYDRTLGEYGKVKLRTLKDKFLAYLKKR